MHNNYKILSTTNTLCLGCMEVHDVHGIAMFNNARLVGFASYCSISGTCTQTADQLKESINLNKRRVHQAS